MGTIGTNRVARENGDNWDKQKVVPRVAAGYAQRLKILFLIVCIVRLHFVSLLVLKESITF